MYSSKCGLYSLRGSSKEVYIFTINKCSDIYRFPRSIDMNSPHLVCISLVYGRDLWLLSASQFLLTIL
jgi:hypothetical protein